MTPQKIAKGSTLLATLNSDNFPFGMADDLKKELYHLLQTALAHKPKKTMIKVITPGHRYELSGFEKEENIQTIQFIQKEPTEDGTTMKTVSDGTTNEDLIEVLINRLSYLQEKFGCKENACAITHLQEAQMWLWKRTATRMARGVEGMHVK